MSESKQIYVVSDATGRTCERVVRAVLSQFDQAEFDLHIWSYVRTPETVEKVVRAACETCGVIVYTLVCPEERKRMEVSGKEMKVKTVDLLGPTLDILSEYLEIESKKMPGLYQELVDEDD